MSGGKQLKQAAASIKLIINASAAKPAPPVGPALGQAGLNIMAFCKEFNAKTANFKEGVPLRVRIQVHGDKTYDWQLKNPPSSWFIKRAAGLLRASESPGNIIAGTISLKHIYEIAKVKIKDVPEANMEGMCKCLIRSCQSMGVQVVAKPEDAKVQ